MVHVIQSSGYYYSWPCPSFLPQDLWMLILFLATVQNQKAKGIKKKNNEKTKPIMGQTISGPLGFASFLNNVSRDVCHSASVSSFAFLGTVPSGSPLSLSFWPHTLPQQAFSDSCLQLLSQGRRLPNLSSWDPSTCLQPGMPSCLQIYSLGCFSWTSPQA